MNRPDPLAPPPAGPRRRRGRALALATLAAVAALFVRGGAAGAEPEPPKGPPPLDARSRDFDQEHLALWVRPDLVAGTVEGRAELTLRALGTPLEAVRLHCVDTTVRAVRDATGRALAHTVDGGQLRVGLAEALAPGAPQTLTVEYEARPTRGLHFHAPCARHPERPLFLYSQGQGTENRRWIPCYDEPDDRLSWEVHVTVPEALETVSNGVRVGQAAAGPGLRTDHWRFDGRAPTYLISLVVADLCTVREAWGDVVLEYSGPPGREADLRTSLRHTPAMMEFFSTYLDAPYPWPRYAQTFVWDFVYGGMENVTATTLNLRALHDGSAEPNYRSDGLVAHELAHMWFGDLLTCRTWEHIWLNEGFATYFTDLFVEHHYGAEEFLVARRAQNRGYLSGTPRPEELQLERSPRNDLPLELGGGKAYSRGAAILHMLRRHLGDAAFRDGLREYVRRNRDQPVVSEQLRRAFEAVAGTDLGWFFEQWVYGVGYPRLTVRYDAERGGLVVRQEQATAGGQGLFRLALPVRSGARGPVQVLQVHRAEHLFLMPPPDGFLRVGVGGDLLAGIEVEQSPHAWARALAEDPDLTGRMDAAEALGAFGAVGVPALARALREDASFAVRRAAAETLRTLREPGAAEALLAGAADADPRVRETVFDALGDTGRALAGEAVRAGLSDPHPAVRGAAARSLGRLKVPGALEALCARLAEESPGDVVRAGALEGLKHLGDPAAIDRARPYLDYRHGRGASHRAREVALDLVCALGAERPDLGPLVVELLDDPYHRMRAWAAKAAGAYRLAAARGRLEAMAKDDPDGGARAAAKTALEQLGG